MRQQESHLATQNDMQLKIELLIWSAFHLIFLDQGCLCVTEIIENNIVNKKEHCMHELQNLELSLGSLLLMVIS